MEAIRYNLFGNCVKLKEINIPQSLKYICPYAFAGCESLESLILPTGIKVCTDDAFPNENTPVLYYLGTRRDWEKATGYGRRKNIFRHKIYFYSDRPRFLRKDLWSFCNGKPEKW